MRAAQEVAPDIKPRPPEGDKRTGPLVVDDDSDKLLRLDDQNTFATEWGYLPDGESGTSH
jgi:hypothetical protein